jgi:AcrR family transcriptional regulator
LDTKSAARNRKATRGRPRVFDDRRLEVLRTAARVFSEQGFRQATLEDIAGALQMTRPALYHYAKSKDALLAECGAIAREQLTAAFAKAKGEPDGASQLATFFRSYSTFVTGEFGRCFALTRLNEMEPEQHRKARQQILLNDEWVGGMIRTGVADGTIRECDAVEVGRAIFDSFNGVARWWNPKRDRPLSEITETILDLFMNGLAPRTTERRKP